MEQPDSSEVPVEYDDDNYTECKTYLSLREHIVDTHFKIKDMIHEIGEQDVLRHWSMENTATFLYHASYIKDIHKSLDEPM